MKDRSLIIFMLFGFALVCSTNLLCFFPQTLFSEVPAQTYRLYNQAATGALIAGCVMCVVLALSRFRNPEVGILISGYVLLPLGLILSSGIQGNSDSTLIIISGIASGMGVSLLMICWFSFLSLVPERYAMLTQGGQALLGSLFFIGIVELFPDFILICALVALAISAIFAITVYRKSGMQKRKKSGVTSLRKSVRTFFRGGSFGQSFTVPLAAFILVSLFYGIVTAAIMAPDNQAHALDQVVIGGIVGAAAFLLWAGFSKKRDYGFIIKVFFGILAFVLILPLDRLSFFAAVGYQLICLLFFALIIDTFAGNRRLLLFVLSLSYALTRGAFFLGLFIPGRFGVTSYAEFTNSASLLFFLVYLVFMALLLFINRERKKSSDQEESLIKTEEIGKRDAYEEMEFNTGISSDLLVASESVGKRNGLTKRETEVLSLLARGRDVGYVCKELYLSRNTVKSYTKIIYAKLNVHSRQELMDLVEAEYQQEG